MNRSVALLLPLLFVLPSSPADPRLKQEALAGVERRSAELVRLSDQVWEYAETALRETRSARLLAGYAEQQGFRVTRGVAGLPTAFVAEFGAGPPVIGILGEYDALPGLSQKTESARVPLLAGKPGHGCGHNMLGAASMGAAVALKDLIAAGRLKGTVRYYGTPAEEAVGGKVYMARDQVFRDVDVMLAWHPSDRTSADNGSSQALVDFAVEFHGKTAHAAFDPWNGRSATHAAEAFVHGVNMLREQVRPTVRMHYTIAKAGEVPNVIADYAKVWMWVRDSRTAGIEPVLARVRQIAQGAALIAGVESKLSIQAGDYEILVNQAGTRMLHRNLAALGPLSYTDQEQEFARAIQRAVGIEERGMNGEVQPLKDPPPAEPAGGSTDVGDVSWVVPTVQARVATHAIGTPGHSWQITAQGKSGQAKKGLVHAAKVMAGVAVDALADPALIARARAEHKARTGATPYQTPLPTDLQPPIRPRPATA